MMTITLWLSLRVNSLSLLALTAIVKAQPNRSDDIYNEWTLNITGKDNQIDDIMSQLLTTVS